MRIRTLVGSQKHWRVRARASMQSACAVLYCHLWPVWLYHIFPHYFINGTIFRKEKVIEHKMCAVIFSTNFISNISHSKNSARCGHKCQTSSSKVPIMLVRSEWNLNFSTDFSNRKVQISNFMKILRMRVELFHAYRRTDMKLIIAFRNFANSPKNKSEFLR